MNGTSAIELMLSVMLPLCTTAAAVSVLRRGTDRALVLPTPLILWLVFMSQRASVALWPMVLAYCAVLVMLYGCWQQRRQVAQWAAIVCGAVAAWLQVSVLLQS